MLLDFYSTFDTTVVEPAIDLNDRLFPNTVTVVFKSSYRSTIVNYYPIFQYSKGYCALRKVLVPHV